MDTVNNTRKIQLEDNKDKTAKLEKEVKFSRSKFLEIYSRVQQIYEKMNCIKNSCKLDKFPFKMAKSDAGLSAFEVVKYFPVFGIIQAHIRKFRRNNFKFSQRIVYLNHYTIFCFTPNISVNSTIFGFLNTLILNM